MNESHENTLEDALEDRFIINKDEDKLKIAYHKIVSEHQETYGEFMKHLKYNVYLYIQRMKGTHFDDYLPKFLGATKEVTTTLEMPKTTSIIVYTANNGFDLRKIVEPKFLRNPSEPQIKPGDLFQVNFSKSLNDYGLCVFRKDEDGYDHLFNLINVSNLMTREYILAYYAFKYYLEHPDEFGLTSAKEQEDKKEVKKGQGDKMSKKPENERLSELVSTAVTSKIKADVKHEAEEKDDSVSQFIRESVKDIVYNDLHPEATVKQLVESGHEKHTEITRRKATTKKEPVIDKENTVSVSQIYKTLSLIKSFKVEKHSELEYLVELLFEKDKMQVIKPSLERSLVITLPFKNDLYAKAKSNKIFVDYKSLFQLFHSTSASTATFSLDTDTPSKIDIIFNTDQVSVIDLVSPDDLPEIQISSNNKREIAHINSDDLLQLLQTVEYSQPTDASMKNLYGVYFEFINGKLILTAIDGFRLGSVQFDIDHKEKTNFLINADDIYFLIKILSSMDNRDVKVSLLSNNIIDFNVENTALMTKVVDAEYPDYRKVIPHEEDINLKIEVSAQVFYDTIKSISAFIAKNTETIYMLFSKESDQLTIASINKDYGSTSLNVPIKVLQNKLEQNEMIFAFNPMFLMEPLKLWSSKGYETHAEGKVELKLLDENRPMIINPLGSTKTIAIVMPIRVDSNDIKGIKESTK